MKSAFLFVVVGLVANVAKSAKLPSYIHPCKADANLNECARDEGNKIIPKLVTGVKSLRIPSLSPLNLPEVSFDASDSLKITLTNLVISGLEAATIDSANIDLVKRHLKFVVAIPQVRIISDYDIHGRILILQIEGNGPANLTFDNGVFTYDLDYKLEDRDGNEYLKITGDNIEYTIGKSHYYFENLFNGDRTLGDQMNNFLNENEQDVTKDIGPAVSKTISSVIRLILNSVFEKIPYKDLLLQN